MTLSRAGPAGPFNWTHCNDAVCEFSANVPIHVKAMNKWLFYPKRRTARWPAKSDPLLLSVVSSNVDAHAPRSPKGGRVCLMSPPAWNLRAVFGLQFIISSHYCLLPLLSLSSLLFFFFFSAYTDSFSCFQENSATFFVKR